MAEENYLRQRLEALRRSYFKDAQPIIDRLVRIKQMQVPEPMLIPTTQLAIWGTQNETTYSR